MIFIVFFGWVDDQFMVDVFYYNGIIYVLLLLMVKICQLNRNK